MEHSSAFILIVHSQKYSSSSFVQKIIHPHRLFTNIFILIICSQIYSLSSSRSPLVSQHQLHLSQTTLSSHFRKNSSFQKESKRESILPFAGNPSQCASYHNEGDNDDGDDNDSDDDCNGDDDDDVDSGDYESSDDDDSFARKPSRCISYHNDSASPPFGNSTLPWFSQLTSQQHFTFFHNFNTWL